MPSIASDRALKQFELITEEESVEEHQIEPNLHMETRQKNEFSESLIARTRRVSAGQRPRRFIDAYVADKYTAYATISQEEFARRNPKWNKATNEPECDDWFMSDNNLERNQQCKQQPGSYLLSTTSRHLTSAPHFFRQECIPLSDRIGANHHRPPVGI